MKKYKFLKDFMNYKKGDVFSIMLGSSWFQRQQNKTLVIMLRTGIIGEVKEEDKWKPKEGDAWFYLGSDFRVLMSRYDNHPWQNDIIAVGNCYPTNIECNSAHTAVLELLAKLKK